LQHHLKAMIRDSHNRRGQPADIRHRPWVKTA
jgi:hypothetical protein